MDLLLWNVYNVRHVSTELTNIKLRGTLRKFAIEHGVNVLVENATDEDNCVRVATLAENDTEAIRAFLKTTIRGVTVDLILSQVPNPVLSKLKVNELSRY